MEAVSLTDSALNVIVALVLWLILAVVAWVESRRHHDPHRQGS